MYPIELYLPLLKNAVDGDVIIVAYPEICHFFNRSKCIVYSTLYGFTYLFQQMVVLQ